MLKTSLFTAFAPLTGPLVPGLVDVIDTSVRLFSPAIRISGVSVGTVGVGVLSGVLSVPPYPLFGETLRGSGISGISTEMLAQATQLGLSTGLTGARTFGGCATVGAGTDISTVAADPTLLAPLIEQQLVLSYGSVGTFGPTFSLGLAIAICTQLNLSVVTSVVAGGALPIPSTGLSTSQLDISSF